MKPNWDCLLDEASLASVLPSNFSKFASPIRDALGRFLAGLPESQQISILLAQAGLSPEASFSQRLGLLAQSSPVLQKLGQVLARDRRLPLELREQLSELESLPPTVPLEAIRASLTRELGPLDELNITLQPAIAEASVAVVVPYYKGTAPARKDIGLPAQAADGGVFKVLKPGIEEQLEHELDLLEGLGEYLDDRCEQLQIPHLDYQESFQLVRIKLLDEILLDLEQRHLLQAKDLYVDDPRVHIPELRDYCTSRVTAMERLSGGKVTTHAPKRTPEKLRLAGLIADALIAQPILSKKDLALFHGDPHAGNLFLTDEGRLGILDWSLVGTLGIQQRVAVVQLLLAAVTLDAERVMCVLAELDDVHGYDGQALKTVAEKWVRRVRQGHFPGMSWLVGMLDEAVQKARLRASADLMLFRKSLLTLEGVVADVGQRAGKLESTMTMEFLKKFAVEYPRRWQCPPDSRDFATRLSNMDVMKTLLSVPTTATRFWLGHTFDILDACVTGWEKPSRLASQAQGTL